MSDSSLDDAALGAGPEDPPDDRGRSSQTEPTQDLGFGSVVSSESRARFLNRDGTFNVRRKGLGILRSRSLYHFLLDVTWPRFFGLVCVWYVVTNAVFAMAYMGAGAGALPGLEAEGTGSGFLAYFFFSVHTLATIGYGHVVPRGTAANLLVTTESLVGLLAFGLAAGLMFARFARPTAHILFSDHALMAPYRGGSGFMFRIVNGRKNQIVELHARIVLTRRKRSGAGREYHILDLERDRVAFFPLAWTVVHPVDEGSPLHGLGEAQLLAQGAEFLVLLTGFDETFSQVVHARSSYRAEEILWGRRFADMFDHDGDDLAVDVDRLSDTVA
ncbi:MAG TPA: ion channel [Longimicrobiales bacterium]|nr:ion channel [Longimicrobiales bacterium]